MKKILYFSLFVTFVLSIYGLDWGLPSRWCIDEPVARAVGMMASKSLIPEGDLLHPTFHYFILILFIAPFLLFLKLTAYPLALVKSAASVSWIHLATVDPNFPQMLYLVARFSSVVFALLIILLTYKLASSCYSKKAGFFGALYLSVTMGFISEAHKSTSSIFLVFMLMLTIFSCIYYVNKKSFYRFIVPFFLGGLTVATKFNGGIVILPLAFYLFTILKEPDGGNTRNLFFVKGLFLSGLMFLAGFFAGFPGLLVNLPDYISAMDYYKTRYVPAETGNAVQLFISGILGYLVTLKDFYGILLFFLVIAGFILAIFRLRNNFALKLIFITVIPYYLAFSFIPKPFEAKYIILITPLILVISSSLIEYTGGLNKILKRSVNVFFVLIWIVSFYYTLCCDRIYTTYDLRYECTKWIEDNIPKDKKIIIAGHPEWVIHTRLFKDREILLLNTKEDNFNQAYNRLYKEGSVYQVSLNDALKVKKELSGSHDNIIIYPVFIYSDRLKIFQKVETKDDVGIDFSKQKVVKEFKKSYNFFWNPNLGGYEPQKIVILTGDK